jgi:hypothetical protein
MQSAASTGSSDLTQVSSMSAAQLVVVVQSQAEKIAALEHQIEWFRRQYFGQKSERFAPEPDPNQLHLGETFPVPPTPSRNARSIPAHTRRVKQRWRRERRGTEVLRRVAGPGADHHAGAMRTSRVSHPISTMSSARR